MNHLVLDYEGTLSNYVGSLDGILYEKIPVDSLLETPLTKIQDAEMGDQDFSMNMRSRRRVGVNLT